MPIRAYALCIVLGVIFAVWLSERRWRARGGQKGTIIDISVPAVIFGLIGGRLYHVITDWQTYFGARAIKPAYKALFIWEGGLGIWGAIALGGVGVWLACRKRGLSLSAVADTVAPGIAFAQAIGRWGNWFNQELYGGPTTLPWGLEIDQMHGGEPGVLYHPTFLYESIWDLLLGFALLWAGKRFALHHGRLFALYVAGYTLGRFWIEGLRIDPVGGVDHAVTFLSLRLNQWTSIVVFIGALIYFWATRNKDSEEFILPAVDRAAAGDPDGPDPAHGADQADQADSADGAAAASVVGDTDDTPEAVTTDSPDPEVVKADSPDPEVAPSESASVQEASADVSEPADVRAESPAADEESAGDDGAVAAQKETPEAVQQEKNSR